MSDPSPCMVKMYGDDSHLDVVARIPLEEEGDAQQYSIWTPGSDDSYCNSLTSPYGGSFGGSLLLPVKASSPLTRPSEQLQEKAEDDESAEVSKAEVYNEDELFLAKVTSDKLSRSTSVETDVGTTTRSPADSITAAPPSELVNVIKRQDEAIQSLLSRCQQLDDEASAQRKELAKQDQARMHAFVLNSKLVNELQMLKTQSKVAEDSKRRVKLQASADAAGHASSQSLASSVDNSLSSDEKQSRQANYTVPSVKAKASSKSVANEAQVGQVKAAKSSSQSGVSPMRPREYVRPATTSRLSSSRSGQLSTSILAGKPSSIASSVGTWSVSALSARSSTRPSGSPAKIASCTSSDARCFERAASPDASRRSKRPGGPVRERPSAGAKDPSATSLGSCGSPQRVPPASGRHCQRGSAFVSAPRPTAASKVVNSVKKSRPIARSCSPPQRAEASMGRCQASVSSASDSRKGTYPSSPRPLSPRPSTKSFDVQNAPLTTPRAPRAQAAAGRGFRFSPRSVSPTEKVSPGVSSPLQTHRQLVASPASPRASHSTLPSFQAMSSAPALLTPRHPSPSGTPRSVNLRPASPQQAQPQKLMAMTMPSTWELKSMATAAASALAAPGRGANAAPSSPMLAMRTPRVTYPPNPNDAARDGSRSPQRGPFGGTAPGVVAIGVEIPVWAPPPTVNGVMVWAR